MSLPQVVCARVVLVNHLLAHARARTVVYVFKSR
jgi:hypothetical protein